MVGEALYGNMPTYHSMEIPLKINGSESTVLWRQICPRTALMGKLSDLLFNAAKCFLKIYSAIESKTHGNVLWAPLDHKGTRIGYAYTPEIASKYPEGISEEVAVKEAIESVKPFTLQFKQVEWWTLSVLSILVHRHPY